MVGLQGIEEAVEDPHPGLLLPLLPETDGLPADPYPLPELHLREAYGIPRPFQLLTERDGYPVFIHVVTSWGVVRPLSLLCHRRRPCYQRAGNDPIDK